MTQFRVLITGTIWSVLAVTNVSGVRAGILGDTVDIQYLYPTTTGLLGLSNSGVVTAGGISLNVLDNQLFTVFADHVDIVGIRDPTSSYGPAAFNGIRVQDLTNLSAFVSASADAASTVVGFDSSRVSLSGGFLFIRNL